MILIQKVKKGKIKLKTNSYRYVKKTIPIEAFKYEGDLSANGEIVFQIGLSKHMKTEHFTIKKQMIVLRNYL